MLLRNISSAGVGDVRKNTIEKNIDQQKFSSDLYLAPSSAPSHHKCQSVGGKNQTAKVNHLLMLGGLESIESDKEDEDMMRISWQQNEIMRKQRLQRYKQGLLPQHDNQMLFENIIDGGVEVSSPVSRTQMSARQESSSDPNIHMSYLNHGTD